MLYQYTQVPCNYGMLPDFHDAQNKAKYWLRVKDIVNIMIHHQHENTISQDGEAMISLGLTLLLLFKMEMEDYSISSTITELQHLTQTPTQKQDEN
jgi:hypothetical protein